MKKILETILWALIALFSPDAGLEEIGDRHYEKETNNIR